MPVPYENIVYPEDCLSGMGRLEDCSADIIIADPPYNIGKNFGNNADNLPLDAYISWSRAWIAECLRILTPCGTMFIYGFPEILAHLSVGLPLKKQHWLQWHYTNKNMPNLDFWQRSHESILCVWKEKPLFNRDAVREPYTKGFLKGAAGRKRPAGKCRLATESGKDTIYTAHANGALPRDVISISSLAGGASLRERNIYCKTCRALVDPHQRRQHLAHELIIHPTQKPLALTKRLADSCRPEGSFNALIPFCGSGSECRCIAGLGGRFAAFEKNPDYVLLANSVLAACS